MKRLVLAALALVLFLSFPARASQLAAQGSHALYLDDRGSVWAWGSNHMGESACASDEVCVPVPLRVFDSAAEIACGRQFSLALTGNGEAWLWGLVPAGMLDNTEAQRAGQPVRLDGGIAHIAACEGAAALLTSAGTVRYFDSAAWRTAASGAVSVALGMDFVLWTDGEGTAFLLEAGAEESQARALMKNVKWVSASGQTALLASEDGTLYALGASGPEGRLGLDTDAWIDEPVPNGVSRAREGVCGVSCSGALTEENELYMWGTLYSYYTAFSADGSILYAAADGTLIRYGKAPVKLFDSVRCAAAGDAFIVLETLDGTLLSWGSNDWGQLGDGSVTRFELVAGEDGEDEDADYEIQVTDYRQAVFPVSPVISK